jgi:hypothetical protein
MSPRSLAAPASLVWLVCGLALVVIALCFAISADLLTGSIVATRCSARFSGLILALALVARTPWRLVEHKAQLALAFVAAHTVHYATVIGRAIIEPSNPLRQLTGENVVVVGGGVG